MPDNFHLAPPASTVDGMLAVPIDIQRLEASFEFDAATGSCAVDATIEFLVGPVNGNPVFDIRQTIDEAWLDGSLIAPALLAHHDFGGGPDARMRIVESILTAGTSHTLRLTYQLALPDAQDSGSGPPTYDWNGERLNLEFWYTDLRPGRYLDAWLPANLIFDQFTAHLDVRIISSTVDHLLITNGHRTDVSMNRWEVDFPAHFTACSSMLRIHPQDEIESRAGSTTLTSAGNVDVLTYKSAGSGTNLAAQETVIISILQTNHTEIGPYAHGDRFTVVFDSPDGMEYAGATKTTTGLLPHEAFHSWWGRGVQPATQNDGWWDEGWTVYATGGSGPVPFDFSDPSVELFSQNPWVRATPGASYSSGHAVFQGLASLMGDAALRSAMSAFYTQHAGGPATTIELEGALLCAAADETVVDAFHRFVYGLSAPSQAPDLWMRDDPGHGGEEHWGGEFWNSPDVWVRNADDDDTTPQSPREDSDNWFYARVRNRGSGTARHFMVSFAVKQWAGTQFTYPDDFIPCIAAGGGFELGPGETQIVKARWPAAQVPPAGTHGCLLASVIAHSDHPTADKHIWEDNNLAQRNLTIAGLDADGWVVIPVLVGSRFVRAKSVLLELIRTRGAGRVRAYVLRPIRPELRSDKPTVDCGGGESENRAPLVVWTDKTRSSWAQERFKGAHETPLMSGKSATYRVESKAGFPVLIGLRLQAPANARKGSSLLTHLVERDGRKRVVGGISVRIDIR